MPEQPMPLRSCHCTQHTGSTKTACRKISMTRGRLKSHVMPQALDCGTESPLPPRRARLMIPLSRRSVCALGLSAYDLFWLLCLAAPVESSPSGVRCGRISVRHSVIDLFTCHCAAPLLVDLGVCSNFWAGLCCVVCRFLVQSMSMCHVKTWLMTMSKASR